LSLDRFELILITYFNLLVVDGLGSSAALNAPLVAGIETLLEGQHRISFYGVR